MSEGDAVEHGATHSLAAFKTKIGPLPLYVWAVAGLGIWWYISKKQKTTTAASTGNQTDPAGNIGVIDPATGYVEGSAEDTAALAGNQSNGDTGGGSAGTSGGGTTGGTYTDNNAWARAAINYLVGLGVDPTEANEAIEQYLSSQSLTTAQQADVNLAIQGLGAPPSVPTPTGTTSPPVVTPPTGTPTGTVYATNPPTGVAVASTTANTVSLKWNNATNATGYTISYGTSPTSLSSSTTAPPSQGGVTIGGLSPSTTYYFSVQATPAKAGAGSASATATTSAGGTTSSPGPSGQTHTYIVVHGDTLIGIAAKNGTTMAVIKQLNPVYWTNPKYDNGNDIVAGDRVVLPGPG